MFTNLLIPIDGSDPSLRAATFGLELAQTYDASVDVLHAVDGEDPAATDRGESLLADVKNLDQAAPLSVETHLVEKKPAKAITSHASEAGTDLVVMGRHGRTGISEHLLGSTSERVLRGVDVPVLTVPGSDGGEVTVEDILLTTDGSAMAERAGPYGADLATRLAATLHLLSVVDVQSEAGPFNAGGVDAAYVDRLMTAAQEDIDRLRTGIDTDGIDVHEVVARGWPIEEIEAYVDEHDIDLVVMASLGESNLVRQKLGSTTSRVLNSVNRPVLVVPAAD